MLGVEPADKSRLFEQLRDRLVELAPWTDPQVVTVDRESAVRVQASHAVAVLATHASGVWHVAVRAQFGEEPGRGVRSHIPQNHIPDTDITAAAEMVLKECIAYWRSTKDSPAASEAMKRKASEQLEALDMLERRTPGNPGVRHAAQPAN